MDINSKRQAVLALHLNGKSNQQIVRDLQALNVNKSFVSRTIKRFRDTGSVNKRYGGGRKPTAVTPRNVQRVRKRLVRNPRRSAKKLATEIDISRTSLRRIMKYKLKVKAYKIQKVHMLTPKQKKVRLDRAKRLKEMADRGELENLVFSDEKLFTIEQVVNKQNDRVYLTDRCSINRKHLRAYRTQKPASVMVWAGIAKNGRTPLVFVPQGVKIDAKIYQRLVLNKCLKPWADKQFGNSRFVFQQDSAPAHKAKTTQAWLQRHVPAFISSQLWPPFSPDLNPMDFSIWGILISKVNSTRHQNLDKLKYALCRE